MLTSCIPLYTHTNSSNEKYIQARVDPTKNRTDDFKLENLTDNQKKKLTKDVIFKLKEFAQILHEIGCDQRDINNILMGKLIPYKAFLGVKDKIVNNASINGVDQEVFKAKINVATNGFNYAITQIKDLLINRSYIYENRPDNSCNYIDNNIAELFTELLNGGFTGVWFEDEKVSARKLGLVFDRLSTLLNDESNLVNRKKHNDQSFQESQVPVQLRTSNINDISRSKPRTQHQSVSNLLVRKNGDGETEARNEFKKEIKSVQTNIIKNGITYAPIDITYANTGVVIYRGLGREKNAKPGIYITLEGESKPQVKYIQVYYQKTYNETSGAEKLILVRQELQLNDGADVSKKLNTKKLSFEEAKSLFNNYQTCAKLEETSLKNLGQDFNRGTAGFADDDSDYIDKSIQAVHSHLENNDTLVGLDSQTLLQAFIPSQIVLCPAENPYKSLICSSKDNRYDIKLDNTDIIRRFKKHSDDNKINVISTYAVMLTDVYNPGEIKIGIFETTTTYALNRKNSELLIQVTDQNSSLAFFSEFEKTIAEIEKVDSKVDITNSNNGEMFYTTELTSDQIEASIPSRIGICRTADGHYYQVFKEDGSYQITELTRKLYNTALTEDEIKESIPSIKGIYKLGCGKCFSVYGSSKPYQIVELTGGNKPAYTDFDLLYQNIGRKLVYEEAYMLFDGYENKSEGVSLFTLYRDLGKQGYDEQSQKIINENKELVEMHLTNNESLSSLQKDKLLQFFTASQVISSTLEGPFTKTIGMNFVLGNSPININMESMVRSFQMNGDNIVQTVTYNLTNNDATIGSLTIVTEYTIEISDDSIFIKSLQQDVKVKWNTDSGSQKTNVIKDQSTAHQIQDALINAAPKIDNAQAGTYTDDHVEGVSENFQKEIEVNRNIIDVTDYLSRNNIIFRNIKFDSKNRLYVFDKCTKYLKQEVLDLINHLKNLKTSQKTYSKLEEFWKNHLENIIEAEFTISEADFAILLVAAQENQAIGKLETLDNSSQNQEIEEISNDSKKIKDDSDSRTITLTEKPTYILEPIKSPNLKELNITIPDEWKQCFGISKNKTQSDYTYLEIIRNAKNWLLRNKEKADQDKREKVRDILIQNLYPHWKSDEIFNLDSRASTRAWNLFKEIKIENSFNNDAWNVIW